MAGPGKLPYKILGGIVPCPGGWLIVPARLAGVTVIADDPEVVKRLADVLDYRPKIDAAAICCCVELKVFSMIGSTRSSRRSKVAMFL